MGQPNPVIKDIVTYVRKAAPYTYTTNQLADIFNVSRDVVHGAAYRNNLQLKKEEGGNRKKPLLKRISAIAKKKRTVDPTNILVIGDIHEPFCLEEYLEFCTEVYERYDCTHVIFIGDLIDNHFASYHEIDPDGLGGGEELQRAIDKIGDWADVFPVADVVIGNHDRLILRKAFSGGIPAQWIKDFKEVLGTPDWIFEEEFVYNDVQYIHGLNGKADTKAKKDLMSTVQGHHHTDAFTKFIVGKTYKIFGTQVGCGIDHKSYAMAYARAFPKPAIGCAVILNNGTQPINVLMDL